MTRLVLARGDRARIPVTVVAGTAGAGRRTLIRRLLERNAPRHVAVLIDEPSSLRLDESLIAASDGVSLVLRNGSVCLSPRDRLDGALRALRDQPLPPEHVVIVPTTDANPVRVSSSAYFPGYRPGGSIFVLRAPTTPEMEDGSIAAAPLAARLRHAELLLVNHIDRIPPAQREPLRRWIRQRAARACIIESEYCRIPTAFVLGAGAGDTPAHAIAGEWAPSYSIDAGSGVGGSLTLHDDDDYRIWKLTASGPIGELEFRDWVSSLPASVVRGDGMLRFAAEPRNRFAFQFCGSAWSLTRDEPWSSDAALGWITLVGFAFAPARPGSIEQGSLIGRSLGSSPRVSPT